MLDGDKGILVRELWYDRVVEGVVKFEEDLAWCCYEDRYVRLDSIRRCIERLQK